MAELIQQYTSTVIDSSGRQFQARAVGEPRADGTWSGWFEFHGTSPTEVLRTGQETSQPDRDALVYWASGIEPIYLEGALARARGELL